MAHSLRAAAVAGTLALAALAVRCEPQTFDLLPELAAGSAGKEASGGKGNSNNGGMFGSGGVDGNGGNGGRASGGKASGGQWNGGATSTGGFGVLTGGRISGGGFAGKPSTIFTPPGCSAYCPASGCMPCTPGGNDNGGCPYPLLCPKANSQLAQSCPVCLGCRATSDCQTGPLTECNPWTKTCAQRCSTDDECTALPQASHCAFDNSNGSGVCAECRDGIHAFCGAGRICNNRNICVDCSRPTDCDNKDPLRPICDMERGICIECDNKNICRNGQRPTCDTESGACVECLSSMDCQFSAQASGVCMNKVCTCTDDAQCVGSPFGRACVTGHCRECGPQAPCANGEVCDASGKCVR